MARVRMSDVAAHAGVSVRTVSNVVNDYVHVSAATRERVQASLDELGYRMDFMARGLRSGRTGFVALAVPHLDEAYFAELAQAVVRAAARRGLTVLVEATGGDPETEAGILAGGLTNVADGVLLSALHLRDETAARSDFPLVLLGEHVPSPMLDHIDIDNVAAARTATAHLLERGCRRIVALGAGSSETARLRYQGYVAAHAAARRRPVQRLAIDPGDWTRRRGADAMERLLDGGGAPPDAVLAFNDALAIGAMRTLTGCGLRIPDDVAVAGIDDINESAFTNPPLTSVSPDLDAIAERSLDLLEFRLGEQSNGSGATPARQESVPFRLVVRESTNR